MKIENSIKKWESGVLGLDDDYAAVDPNNEQNKALTDKSLGLKMLHIRLEDSLIEDFKMLGEIEGVGYQALMRTVLQNYAKTGIKVNNDL